MENGAEEKKWYQKIECIDGDIAIKNSGSEDAFKEVLKIFHDSVPEKSREIEEFFNEKNWQDYTIKVHALKSSARLIGATDLADKAQNLEFAGKGSNIDYILTNHENLIREYKALDEALGVAMAGFFEKETGPEKEKPLADSALMESVYEELHLAAKNMDCDTLGDILKEMEEYRIPDSEKERYDAICRQVDNFAYDKILEILDNR